MIRWLDFTDFMREISLPQVEDKLTEAVESIISKVRSEGDKALVELTRRFDKPDFTEEEMILEPAPTLSGQLAEQMSFAARRIRGFAEALMSSLGSADFPSGTGVRFVPVEKAGIYAPGGRAPYPSSVLMGAIPARVAGVKEIYVASPPPVHPAIVHASWLSGAKGIIQLGGAQAIAAMAIGTDRVKRVDFIAGPGNSYVQEAKRLLWGTVGIDTIAGPSEVCVLCDGSADPQLAAWEIAAQAEHDPEARSYPILLSDSLRGPIEGWLERIVRESPRHEITQSALAKSPGLIARSTDEAAEAINAVAPEHLVIMTESPETVAEMVKSAGALFLGPWSPVAAGDYAAGPSHILPTGRWARFSSGLSPLSFLRIQGVVNLSAENLKELGPAVISMAESEGFWAHKKSVEVRIDKACQQ